MIGALGGVLDYLVITQNFGHSQLMKPVVEKSETVLEIDQHTRKNLEINVSLAGEQKGSLFDILNICSTSLGSRLLSRRLNTPLTKEKEIKLRLQVTEFLFVNANLTDKLRVFMNDCPDFDRAFSRISLNKQNFKEILKVKKGIFIANEVQQVFNLVKKEKMIPSYLNGVLDRIDDFTDILHFLDNAISEDLVEHSNHSSNIKPNFSEKLDKLRMSISEGAKIIRDLENELIIETGISSLKIKNNNVLGYFIELTSKGAELLKKNEAGDNLIHRQSTANTARYTTSKLLEIETSLNSASREILEFERVVFNEIKEKLQEFSSSIRESAHAVAEIDFFCTLANISRERKWVEPEISNQRVLSIIGGRHPVLEEQALEKSLGTFIPNNCQLIYDKCLIYLITGPNMAGKSTYLRQNALIIILAQVGCFVPAEKAEIGIVDRIFSRVGASDDLSQGHSTFMVEMLETATILNLATEKSFVILDEIGRGTSTFDGLSIAWATLEHLHYTNKCRTLFATHYHELTFLEQELDLLKNMTVKIKEHNQSLIFLHQIVPGSSNRSFGIKVAELAGVPKSVIERASEVAQTLEEENKIFDVNESFSKNEPHQKLETISVNVATVDFIRNLELDDISPKESLHILYKIQREIY